MAKKLDFTMGRLFDITKSFVKKAERYCGPDAPYYEPPRDQSHIYSELCSSVEHAKDTLEMIHLETEQKTCDDMIFLENVQTAQDIKKEGEP